MCWKVTHACVRGSSHQRSGLPNQDAVEGGVTRHGAGAVAVAVVSDGHGAPRHFRSQTGSSLAVSTASGALRDYLVKTALEDAPAAFQPGRLEELKRSLVEGWLAAIQSDLSRNPFTPEELAALERTDGAASRRSVEDFPQLAYGATLLAAAATGSSVLFLQLGDGDILTVSRDGKTSRPLPPDERLVGNQTTSLCQPEAWKDFRAAWISGSIHGSTFPALVVLSTDGYVNSFRSDEDFLRIGRDYLEMIREQGLPALAEELPGILKDATEQGSGDDIALAILQHEPTGSSSGTYARPALSAASRSAILEQIKAQHSSQQRRIEALSSQLSKTRGDYLRLRNLAGTLVILAAMVPVVVFRDRIFLRSGGAGATPTGRSGGTPIPPAAGPSVPAVKPPPRAAGPAAAAARKPGQWVLRLSAGRRMDLRKGSKIPARFLRPAGSGGPYAEVARQGADMMLINESEDVWSVRASGEKQAQRIARGQSWKLGAQTAEIVFAPGLSAELSAVGPAKTAGQAQ